MAGPQIRPRGRATLPRAARLVRVAGLEKDVGGMPRPKPAGRYGKPRVLTRRTPDLRPVDLQDFSGFSQRDHPSLKIVVSSVRFRVSPFLKTPACRLRSD